MQLILTMLAYFVIMNIIAFYQMYKDKQYSIKRRWRVPEKDFFIIALLGGSLGCIIGMKKFRHKTKHTQFVVLMPIIFFLNIVCYYKVYEYLMIK